MVILLAGLAICVGFAAQLAGGMGEMLAAFPAERAAALNPAHGLGDGAKTPFWGFLVGGFFLYISYYGVDQSQAQRELSAPNVADTKRSLTFNGLARFPMTLLYVCLGIATGSAFVSMPELQATVPHDKLDYLVPNFVLMYLPTGIRALIFAAILAAAMSSLDSAINSLSAATMRDFVQRLGGALDDARVLRWSRITTALWGAVVILFAFLVGGISDTAVEGINKVGSAFYGPVLAVFLAGVVWRRATGPGVIAGCAVGVVFNLVVWVALPSVFWMWWNLFGVIVAVAVAAVVSLAGRKPDPQRVDETMISWSGFLDRERPWLPVYGALVTYFVLILLVVALSGRIVEALRG
jgi:SSS family solute:Na+ symporter